MSTLHFSILCVLFSNVSIIIISTYCPKITDMILLFSRLKKSIEIVSDLLTCCVRKQKLNGFSNYKMKFIYRILAFVLAAVLMLIAMTVTYVAYLKVLAY